MLTQDRLEHEYFGGLTPAFSTTHHYTTTTTTGPEAYSNGMVIPRPHIHPNNNTAMHVNNESSTDIVEIRPRPQDRSKQQKPAINYQNTFQRDLNRAVDNYRSARDIYPQAGHM